jgi:hypothetical protein
VIFSLGNELHYLIGKTSEVSLVIKRNNFIHLRVKIHSFLEWKYSPIFEWFLTLNWVQKNICEWKFYPVYKRKFTRNWEQRNILYARNFSINFSLESRWFQKILWLPVIWSQIIWISFPNYLSIIKRIISYWNYFI